MIVGSSADAIAALNFVIVSSVRLTTRSVTAWSFRIAAPRGTVAPAQRKAKVAPLRKTMATNAVAHETGVPNG